MNNIDLSTEAVSKRIKARMHKLGMGIVDLGNEVLSVDKPTLRKYLDGSIEKMDAFTLCEIAYHLHTNVSTLMGLEIEPTATTDFYTVTNIIKRRVNEWSHEEKLDIIAELIKGKDA